MEKQPGIQTSEPAGGAVLASPWADLIAKEAQALKSRSIGSLGPNESLGLALEAFDIEWALAELKAGASMDAAVGSPSVARASNPLSEFKNLSHLPRAHRLFFASLFSSLPLDASTEQRARRMFHWLGSLGLGPCHPQLGQKQRAILMRQRVLAGLLAGGEPVAIDGSLMVESFHDPLSAIQCLPESLAPSVCLWIAEAAAGWGLPPGSLAALASKWMGGFAKRACQSPSWGARLGIACSGWGWVALMDVDWWRQSCSRNPEFVRELLTHGVLPSQEASRIELAQCCVLGLAGVEAFAALASGIADEKLAVASRKGLHACGANPHALWGSASPHGLKGQVPDEAPLMLLRLSSRASMGAGLSDSFSRLNWVGSPIPDPRDDALLAALSRSKPMVDSCSSAADPALLSNLASSAFKAALSLAPGLASPSKSGATWAHWAFKLGKTAKALDEMLRVEKDAGIPSSLFAADSKGRRPMDWIPEGGRSMMFDDGWLAKKEAQYLADQTPAASADEAGRAPPRL